VSEVPFSIVVVTWNCADALSTLAGSLNEHLADTEPQLVVVDNASDDDPFAAARRWAGPLELVRLPENRGFGAAANEGVRQAGGDVVVLLNPDTWLVDASLRDLARAALDRDALVGPRILDPDGSVQPSASGPVTGPWPWIRAFVPGAISPAPLAARTEPWRLDRAARVTWLTGACLAASRERLLALGPFDESLHLYAEDLDLGLRAARQGIESWFQPDVARVVHVGDVSSGRRYADAGLDVAAVNARLVLERAFGERAAARALRADRLRLRLRLSAKKLVRRPTERDRAALAALRRAAAGAG
jgi:GT2 family glycosyltransferase